MCHLLLLWFGCRLISCVRFNLRVNELCMFFRWIIIVINNKVEGNNTKLAHFSWVVEGMGCWFVTFICLLLNTLQVCIGSGVSWETFLLWSDDAFFFFFIKMFHLDMLLANSTFPGEMLLLIWNGGKRNFSSDQPRLLSAIWLTVYLYDVPVCCVQLPLTNSNWMFLTLAWPYMSNR